MDFSKHPTAIKLRELTIDPVFTDARVAEAVDVNESALLNFDSTDAWAGMNGEIIVAAWAGKNFYQFQLEMDGSWSFLHEIEDEEFANEKELNFEDLVGLMLILPV